MLAALSTAAHAEDARQVVLTFWSLIALVPLDLLLAGSAVLLGLFYDPKTRSSDPPRAIFRIVVGACAVIALLALLPALGAIAWLVRGDPGTGFMVSVLVAFALFVGLSAWHACVLRPRRGGASTP